MLAAAILKAFSFLRFTRFCERRRNLDDRFATASCLISAAVDDVRVIFDATGAGGTTPAVRDSSRGKPIVERGFPFTPPSNPCFDSGDGGGGGGGGGVKVGGKAFNGKVFDGGFAFGSFSTEFEDFSSSFLFFLAFS